MIRSASRSLRQWTAVIAFAWLAPMWAGAQIGLPAPDPGACDPSKASCIKVCSPLDAMLGKCKPGNGAPSDPGPGGGGGGGTCTPPPGGTPGCGGGGPAAKDAGGPSSGGGNPINLINGNKFQPETDLAPLPGELGLEFRRYYNSQSSHPGLLGSNWRMSYETVLYDFGGQIQIVQADGQRLMFQRGVGARAALCSTPRASDGQIRIEEPKDGRGQRTYHWRWPDGRSLMFSGGAGGGYPLQAITAAGGQRLTLAYSPGGELIQVRDPQGRKLNFIYGAAGKARSRGLQAVDTPVGRISFAQDAQGRLAEVSLAKDAASAPHLTRVYHYEDKYNGGHANALTGISLLAFDGAGKKPQLQRLSTYAYNKAGQAILSTKGWPREVKDGQPVPDTGVEQIDLAFVEKSLPFEGKADKVTGEVVPRQLGKTVLTNSLGQTTEVLHAVIGGRFRLVEMRGPGCGTCGPGNMRYAYDAQGQLIRATSIDAQGRPVRSELTVYDAQGRVAKVGERLHDASGKDVPVRWIRRYEYADVTYKDGSVAVAPLPSVVARPSVVAGRERITRMSYDAQWRIASVTEEGFSPVDEQGRDSAQGQKISRTTNYRYTMVGGVSVLSEIDGPLANGPKNSPDDSDVTRLEWDAASGRVARVVHPLGLVEQWSYDDAGRILSHRDTDGVATRYAYDAQGRVIERERAGVKDRIEHRADDDQFLRNGEVVWRTARDARGRLTHFVDAAGGQRVFAYDSEGRNVAQAAFDATSAQSGKSVDVLPVGFDTADGASFTSSRGDTDALNAFAPVETHAGAQGTHSRVFDDFGRVVRIRNPASGTAFARYDAADRLVYSEDEHGRSQQLQYDAMGRLRAHWHTQGGQRRMVREFDYRGALLVAARSPDVSETRSYDGAGQLVERTREISGHRYVERFAYDDSGRMVAQSLPDGTQVAYAWEADRIKGVRINGQQVVSNIAYAPGSMTPVSYALGEEKVTWSWDDARGARMVGWETQRWRQGDLSPAQGAAPLRTAAIETLLPSAHAAAPAATATPAISVVARNELLSSPAATVAADASVDIERDARGLPASWHDWRLEFDASNRLVTARDAARIRRYAYDAWGAQSVVHDEADHVARIALYSGYRRTLEADAQGRITAQYVYLPAPGAWRPVARITSQGVETLFTDTRGAVVEARSLGGTRTWTARYDDNGALVDERAERPGWASRTWNGLRYSINRLWQRAKGFPAADVTDPSDTIALRMPGQAADPDTGLYYNFNRHYDPAIGRYLEPDPQGVAGGDDVYAYADGQPLTGIDPWGLAKIRYFAIDDGVLVSSDGMPDKGHWAYAVYDIADNMDKVLIFDKGGSYLGGKTSELFKGTSAAVKVGNFGDFYGGKSGYYSPAEFEITISDFAAKGIVMNLTGEDLGLGACPASNSVLLPKIDLGQQGTLDPMAKASKTTEDNRIIPCKPGASAEDVRFERIKKAIEAHESSDADCAKNTSAFGGKPACPAGTWNPSVVPGTSDRAPASYGWVQFIFRTFAGELAGNYAAYKTTLDSLGVTKAQLDNAMKRMDATKKWYDKIGTVTWDKDGAAFTADTGLDKVNFEHMQAWSLLKTKVEGAMGDTASPLFKLSQTGKQAADRVNPDLWRSNLQKDTKLTWTTKGPDGKPVKAEETDEQFAARKLLRDELNDLATKSGTSLSAKTLNPYIRNPKNWGESTAGFQVAAVLGGDKPLAAAFLKIFTDKPTHDQIADVWIKKLIKRVGTDGLASTTPTTVAGEKDLAEWVFSKHNGGEGKKTKITDYVNKTDRIWERTFCLAGTGSKLPGYIRMTALDPK